MSVEFKQKQYGYKVVDEYGDKLGEIHTDGMVPLFECSKSCGPKTTNEMMAITDFMYKMQNYGNHH